MGTVAVTTVTVAVAVTDVSATDVTVMMTMLLGVGTAGGALYTPVQTGWLLEGLVQVLEMKEPS